MWNTAPTYLVTIMRSSIFHTFFTHFFSFLHFGLFLGSKFRIFSSFKERIEKKFGITLDSSQIKLFQNKTGNIFPTLSSNKEKCKCLEQKESNFFKKSGIPWFGHSIRLRQNMTPEYRVEFRVFVMTGKFEIDGLVCQSSESNDGSNFRKVILSYLLYLQSLRPKPELCPDFADVCLKRLCLSLLLKYLFLT